MMACLLPVCFSFAGLNLDHARIPDIQKMVRAAVRWCHEVAAAGITCHAVPSHALPSHAMSIAGSM